MSNRSTPTRWVSTSARTHSTSSASIGAGRTCCGRSGHAARSRSGSPTCRRAWLGWRHHLSRKLQSHGHDARLMPAKYGRPYVKGQKNDFNDAEAIAEAVQRPTMKFVATKTAEQLDLQAAAPGARTAGRPAHWRDQPDSRLPVGARGCGALGAALPVHGIADPHGNVRHSHLLLASFFEHSGSRTEISAALSRTFGRSDTLHATFVFERNAAAPLLGSERRGSPRVKLGRRSGPLLRAFHSERLGH
jgi:hypothetical protein